MLGEEIGGLEKNLKTHRVTLEKYNKLFQERGINEVEVDQARSDIAETERMLTRAHLKRLDLYKRGSQGEMEQSMLGGEKGSIDFLKKRLAFLDSTMPESARMMIQHESHRQIATSSADIHLEAMQAGRNRELATEYLSILNGLAGLNKREQN